MPVTLGSWLFDNDSNGKNDMMNDTRSRTKEGTLIFDRESTVVSGSAPPGSMYRDHHDGIFYRGGGDQNNTVMSSRPRGLYPEDTTATTTTTTANDTKKRKKKRTVTRKNSLHVGSPESQGPEPARYY